MTRLAAEIEEHHVSLDEWTAIHLRRLSPEISEAPMSPPPTVASVIRLDFPDTPS